MKGTICNSGLKLIKILSILSSCPYGVNQVRFELSKEDINVDKKTITKYFRTLRAQGYEIKNANGRLKITNTPFKFALTEEELRGMRIFDSVMRDFFENEKDTYESEILPRLLNLFDIREDFNKNKILKEKIPPISGKLAEKIAELSKYLELKEIELSFKYHNEDVFAVAKELRYKKDGIYLFCCNMNKGKDVLYNIEDIQDIAIKSLKSAKVPKMQDKITFKITGRLRKNYVLKEGEKSYFIDGEMIVLNTLENEETLLKRLLKYGKYCEVLYPHSVRENFIKNIQKLISCHGST